MAKIAVCSDIHGNLRRLSLFVNQLEKEGIPAKRVFVLGDLVHYGATGQENACVDLFRYSPFNVVKGNHDEMTCYITEGLPLPERRISKENLNYLASLPQSLTSGDQVFMHSPTEAHVRTEKQFQDFFDFLHLNYPTSHLCFFGHSHDPSTYCETPSGRQFTEERKVFKISKGLRYLINPGALGTGPKGNYIVLESSDEIVERRELP